MRVHPQWNQVLKRLFGFKKGNRVRIRTTWLCLLDVLYTAYTVQEDTSVQVQPDNNSVPLCKPKKIPADTILEAVSGLTQREQTGFSMVPSLERGYYVRGDCMSRCLTCNSQVKYTDNVYKKHEYYLYDAFDEEVAETFANVETLTANDKYASAVFFVRYHDILPL